MTTDSDDLIRKHYQKEAEKDGDSSLSTIGERVVREKEVALIGRFLNILAERSPQGGLSVLDAGCGNGYTLETLRTQQPSLHLHGLEFTEELYKIARNRGVSDCAVDHGDIRSTPYAGGFFDAVYTERCLINILDAAQQEVALREIARILKPGGHYLMLECFNDGLDNNNKARREMGLQDLPPAYHNRYFDQQKIFPAVSDVFDVIDPTREAVYQSVPANFLSSHFFVARILQPLLTKGEWVRNTEFVKFFSFLEPHGNYAPIQAYILKKK